MSTHRTSRRQFLGVGVGGAGVAAAAIGARRFLVERHPVHIARAASYDIDLRPVVREGLQKTGQAGRFHGKRVLLKPNLVETSSGQVHINTHPALVAAAAEVMRELGARDVVVADGPAHHRDIELVLDESGMGDALDAHGLPFVDLNHDALERVENGGGFTSLRHLVLPRTVLDADIIVSMPKLKTHHWAGATLSMKNCFGVMPGLAYGWPKNRLHHEQIYRSVLDIVATVRPQVAIVDGIVGMEGDGPIMGRPKPMGIVVVGGSLPAVDATCVRLMRIDPAKIEYLVHCPRRLGHTDESRIELTGESIEAVASRFALPPRKEAIAAPA